MLHCIDVVSEGIRPSALRGDVRQGRIPNLILKERHGKNYTCGGGKRILFTV